MPRSARSLGALALAAGVGALALGAEARLLGEPGSNPRPRPHPHPQYVRPAAGGVTPPRPHPPSPSWLHGVGRRRQALIHRPVVAVVDQPALIYPLPLEPRAPEGPPRGLLLPAGRIEPKGGPGQPKAQRS